MKIIKIILCLVVIFMLISCIPLPKSDLETNKAGRYNIKSRGDETWEAK